MTTMHLDCRRPLTIRSPARLVAFLAEREVSFRLWLATIAYPLYVLATASVARAWWSFGLSVRVVTMALDVVVAAVAIRQLLLERPRLLAMRRSAVAARRAAAMEP